MIDINWSGSNKTILLWTFHDGWTAQDFITAFTQTENALANVPNPSNTHILLDVQHTTHLPKDALTLGRYAIKRSVDNRHKGLIVIINPSGIWNRFYDILKLTVPNSLKICFASDTNEAHQIIHDTSALSATNKT